MDLFDLDLSELAEIEVTSVSRRSESALRAPAAVYVVTAEEIRRHGFTSIPEALRLVPGVQVARFTGSRWAVSMRGFNSDFASKLLVMIDGRTVYTPLFSGVYWDVQDLMIEDVERIEVIRGPGGSVWGANAVNGVINVITRSAPQTQGVSTVAAFGTEEQARVAARYGGTLGENAHFRVWGTTRHYGELKNRMGERSRDDWFVHRGGFRAEGRIGAQDRWSLDVGSYVGRKHMLVHVPLAIGVPVPRLTDTSSLRGGHVLGRWERDLGSDERLAIQMSWDTSQRNTVVLNEGRDTFDLDFQHEFGAGSFGDVVWGLGWRYSDDETDESFSVSFSPASREDAKYSGFVQGTTHWLDERVRLTLGTKLEYDTFSGWEFQPSARTAVAVADDLVVWGAVSRAVRTPSRADNDLRLNFGSSGSTLIASIREDMAESETLWAFEAGVRWQPRARLSFDVALYEHRYHRLVAGFPNGVIFETTPAPPHTTIVSGVDNLGEARVRGVEALARFEPHRDLRLTLAYTYLASSYDYEGAASSVFDEGRDPQHQGSIRALWTPFEALDVDAALYAVDKLRAGRPASFGGVDEYWRLDLRVAWRVRPGLELWAVGRNLTDDRHSEWWDDHGIPASDVERSGLVGLTWNFDPEAPGQN